MKKARISVRKDVKWEGNEKDTDSWIWMKAALELLE